MQYGICLLSVIPARKEPSGVSEMVTQLLFGEEYTVIELANDWLKIKTTFDHYECWISIKQHHRISETTFTKLKITERVFSNEFIHLVTNKLTQHSFPITIGATLPFYNAKTLSFDSFVFEFEGQTASQNKKKSAKAILDTAFLFLNAPYLWGGKTPFGIDCSGFVQIVYKLNGYQLARDAYQQVELGEPLNFVEEAQAGDLAYFDNDEGKIVHVGILLNNEQIIHASGSVRVDKYDHYGIFNSDTKKYSHNLRVIKRIITS